MYVYVSSFVWLQVDCCLINDTAIFYSTRINAYSSMAGLLGKF